ncbi:IS66 family transposase zinc-finger binding domain-containing protein [Castellaniella sp.]|uniref:IS66 family transposase zinc-finger binding domain-containing protein n=1 Tax=Castellaniella sp. TaxID=1955812 RepID=UPI002AFEE87C|nr:IS66 family transposase zinc-finger binding domain-containing protein [Castellaniella sp.]
MEIRHEPHDATYSCGCQLKFVCDEVTEKLDYTPGTFTVELHVRPILACPECETIAQVPMSAYVVGPEKLISHPSHQISDDLRPRILVG